MVLHELATNAARHGALSVPGGRVSLTWTLDERADRLTLRWVEEGGPPVRPSAAAPAHGFGSRVIEATVSGQLGGALRVEWDPAGLRCTLSLPGGRVLAARAEQVPGPVPA